MPIATLQSPRRRPEISPTSSWQSWLSPAKSTPSSAGAKLLRLQSKVQRRIAGAKLLLILTCTSPAGGHHLLASTTAQHRDTPTLPQHLSQPAAGSKTLLAKEDATIPR